LWIDTGHSQFYAKMNFRITQSKKIYFWSTEWLLSYLRSLNIETVGSNIKELWIYLWSRLACNRYVTTKTNIDVFSYNIRTPATGLAYVQISLRGQRLSRCGLWWVCNKSRKCFLVLFYCLKYTMVITTTRSSSCCNTNISSNFGK
jgi:hypothetical protein